MVLRTWLSLCALVLSVNVFAENAPLSPAFKNLRHPVNDLAFISQGNLTGTPARNDVLRVISEQSSVKDQSGRGTCSIFSTTAMLEGRLVGLGLLSPGADLSEEWLQYLTTQTSPEEGSTSAANFELLRKWGQPSEGALPYGGEGWTSKAQGLALRRCGYLPRGPKLRACLVSHRDPDLLNMTDAELLNPNTVHYDPEFVNARKEALLMRDHYLLKGAQKDGLLKTVSEIHSLLAAGIPLTLDIEFFYGAWNYPTANKKGVVRNAGHWKEGVISYPEKGSVDRQVSLKADEGHSVVVVGYDNDVEVTYVANYKNGSKKTFTRKGVYYIKNSWGTGDWGSEFQIGGRKLPGYGMILQDNAHEFGEFFNLEL